MTIEITIEKLEEPWKASRPWYVAMFDTKAKVPARPVLQWHLKTKKAALERIADLKDSAYYRNENGL